MAVETGRKVIVVGAGCAGLSAAYTLHKQGIEPIVYEAGEHTGGRCRTIVVDGYQMAVGAAVTEPQWHTTFQYLDELGLKDQIEWDTQMRLAFEGDGKIRTITIPKSFPDLVRHLTAHHWRTSGSSTPTCRRWTMRTPRTCRSRSPSRCSP